MGTNGEPALNNNKRLTDFCTFNNLKIINTFFQHKEIYKFTWEATGYKSISDYFVTNMKTLTAIQYIRVQRSTELDGDHYILSAKIHI